MNLYVLEWSEAISRDRARPFIVEAEDWKYSSARNWFLSDAGVIQLNYEYGF